MVVAVFIGWIGLLKERKIGGGGERLVFVQLSPFSGCFLSQIVCQGQQPGFHHHLIDAPEHKALKMMIVFNIGKDRFGIEAALLSFLDAPFG